MKKVVIRLGDIKYLVRVEHTVLQPNTGGAQKCIGPSGRRCIAHHTKQICNCQQIHLAINKELGRKHNQSCLLLRSLNMPDECYTIIKFRPCKEK